MVGFVGTLRGYLKTLRYRVTDPRLRLLAATCLGYFVAISGQMLVNGGAHHFASVCVLLGVFRGITLRCTQEDQQDSAEAVAETAQPVAATRPRPFSPV